MKKRVLLTMAVLALSGYGCAKVSVLPLDKDGKKLANVEEGVRYYPPNPYLLITENPVDSVSAVKEIADGKGKTTIKTAPAKGPDDQTPPAPDGGSGSAPSGTGNTSFGMFTKQYGIKLIYLPDLAHPMSISESGGLFGSSQMKPALQDGWMLTSLDASADSKVADTLTPIASIVSGIKGGGSSAAGTSADGGSSASQKVLMQQLTGAKPSNLPVLPTGLYEFVYGTNGNLERLRAVAYFCHDGIKYANVETAPIPQACP
jgi:hypothetical protein